MATKTDIQSDALAALLPFNNAGAEISMGVGKCLLGLKHMDHFFTGKEHFLVAAPKKSIFQSWLDDAHEFGYEHLIPYITFTTYLSLPKQDLEYTVVYLDECHSLLYNHEPWLSSFTGRVVGFTGTWPGYIHSEKGKMVERYCPLKYIYKTDEAVDDDILNDYRIVVHMLNLSRVVNYEVETRTKSWTTSEYKDYAYWCKRLDESPGGKDEEIARIMRMKALQNYPTKEVYAKSLLSIAKNKVILFANTQVQADALCSHSYHSKNPLSEDNLQEFKTGTITQLSAVFQLNEGVNIPDLKSGILMHAYANNRKAAQRIGRLLRLNPDQCATAHILCYMDSIDREWTQSALADFDQAKITWHDPKNPKLNGTTK